MNINLIEPIPTRLISEVPPSITPHVGHVSPARLRSWRLIDGLLNALRVHPVTHSLQSNLMALHHQPQ